MRVFSGCRNRPSSASSAAARASACSARSRDEHSTTKSSARSGRVCRCRTRPRPGRRHAGRCSPKAGEITPPCGVPVTVLGDNPISKHTRLQPQPKHASAPADPTRAPRPARQKPRMVDLPEEIADIGLKDEHSSLRKRHPDRFQSVGPGRPLRTKPRSYTAGSRPRISVRGRSSLSPAEHTRSRTVGMPSGWRFRPSGFGISTRRTSAGAGRLPARRSRRRSSPSIRSTP